MSRPMRLTTPNTLLAIASGIAVAITVTVVFCVPPEAARQQPRKGGLRTRA